MTPALIPPTKKRIPRMVAIVFLPTLPLGFSPVVTTGGMSLSWDGGAAVSAGCSSTIGGGGGTVLSVAGGGVSVGWLWSVGGAGGGEGVWPTTGVS